MITVADTSPICYLLLIGEIELLPTLFGEVVIPNAVAEELHHPLAPAVLREWLELPPAWLQVDRPTGRESELAERKTGRVGEAGGVVSPLVS